LYKRGKHVAESFLTMNLLNSPWSATNHRRQHNVTVN